MNDSKKQAVVYDDEKMTDFSDLTDDELEAELSDAETMNDAFRVGLLKAERVNRLRVSEEPDDGTTQQAANDELASKIRAAEESGNFAESLRLKASQSGVVV